MVRHNKPQAHADGTGALSYYGYDLATATNTFNAPVYKTEKIGLDSER